MTARDHEDWKNLKAKARKGDSEAEYNIGLGYADGIIGSNGEIIVDVNPRRAVFWYTKSALHGNSGAQLNLGYCYDTGFGVRKDRSKAFYWYKKAYKNKDCAAANNIAILYREAGKPRLAFTWFQKALKTKDDGAFVHIGYHYLKGFGVRRNYDLALENFKNAVDAEYITEFDREKAMFYIGLMYYEGLGVKKSIAKAKKWFEMANQDNDNADAIDMLSKIKEEKACNPQKNARNNEGV